MVPKDHFLRVIEEHFDWDFIYDEVEKLYSKVGRKSIDPVVLIKIHIDVNPKLETLNKKLV